MKVRGGVLALASVAALAAAPLRAQAPLSDLTFLPACTTVSDDIDAIATTLGQSGWQLQAELSDEMVDDIAWVNSTAYFAGDSGGETLDRILELQRKAARGMARKVDTPRGKTRFLARGDETLVLAVRKTMSDATEVECRVAADSATMAGLRASLGDTTAYAAYKPLDPFRQGNARIAITLLNANRLAGYDAPDAIVFTYAVQGG